MDYEELKKLEDPNLIFDKMLEEGLTTDNAKESKLDKYVYLTPKRGFNLFKRCCKTASYDLDYETTYIQNLDSRVIVIRATAGSGKTTAVSIKVAREIAIKGINPKRVCILSFNKSSVRDLTNRVNEKIEKFNLETSRFGTAIDIRERPNIRSLNSLTYNLVKQFSSRLGINEVNIVTDTLAYEIMSSTVKNISKDMNNAFVPSNEIISNLCSLYDLLNETLGDIENFERSTLLAGINVSIAKKILASYKEKLKLRGLMAHSDTCRLIVEKAKEDKYFRQELETFYQLIIADEFQDISEATYQLLLTLTGKQNKLWCVGDGDQSIYRFKGSRANNCELLVNDMPDAVMCNLTLNRRTRENILEMGRDVLRARTDREGPLPRAKKQGGTLNNITYESKKEVIEELADKFSSLPVTQLSEHAIGYRKNFSAFYIVNIFLERAIPFQIKDDFKPGTDLFSMSLNMVMSLLKSPSNISNIVDGLFKVTSSTKIPPLDKVNKILEKNYKQRDLYNKEIIADYFDALLDELDIEYFYEIPPEYLSEKNHDAISEQLDLLEELSNKIKSKGKLKDIVPKVYDLMCGSYWNYMRTLKNFPEELEAMVLEDWCRDMSYTEYKVMKDKQEEKIRMYTEKGYGVNLYSMHSLKGLEYPNMYLVELESGTMPLIKKGIDYTEEELEDIINEELRLLYVGITRAEDNLNLYWSSKDVSPFYEIAEEYDERNEVDKTEVLNLGLGVGSDNNNNMLDISSNYLSSDLDKTFDLFIELEGNSEDTKTEEEVEEELGLFLDNETNKDVEHIEQEDTMDDTRTNNEEGVVRDYELDDKISIEEENRDVEDLGLLSSNNEEVEISDIVEENDLEELLNLNMNNKEMKEKETKKDLVEKVKEDSKIQNKLFTQEDLKYDTLKDSDDNDGIENEEEVDINIDLALKEFEDDEDFVPYKNGKTLKSILGVVCKSIL